MYRIEADKTHKHMKPIHFKVILCFPVNDEFKSAVVINLHVIQPTKAK